MQSERDAPPLVFVTVGTDHHRFDRLMDAIEKWGAQNPGVRIVVQHGTGRAIDGMECSPYLTPPRFRELLGSADAVVCPGGPGAIMEARAAGLRPIVMPRRAHLEEHVDDHQLTFSRFLAAHDLVTLAEEGDELLRALDLVLGEPDAHRVAEGHGSASGIAGVASLVDDLVWEER